MWLFLCALTDVKEESRTVTEDAEVYLNHWNSWLWQFQAMISVPRCSLRWCSLEGIFWWLPIKNKNKKRMGIASVSLLFSLPPPPNTTFNLTNHQIRHTCLEMASDYTMALLTYQCLKQMNSDSPELVRTLILFWTIQRGFELALGHEGTGAERKVDFRECFGQLLIKVTMKFLQEWSNHAL